MIYASREAYKNMYLAKWMTAFGCEISEGSDRVQSENMANAYMAKCRRGAARAGSAIMDMEGES